MRLARFTIALGLGLLLGACHDGDNDAAESEGAEAEAAASASAKPRRSSLQPKLMPTGPSLAIEAGKGVGAIRLGATVATIERLMGIRCEVLSENVCRYYTRGVDFHLVNGVLDKVHVQRAGRPAGKDWKGEKLEFGFFNGGIRPDLALGMKPKAMQEYIGVPERVERVQEPNPQNMVARDHYPGVIIEYDRYKNGNIIWAGAVVFRDPRTDTLPELGMRSGKWAAEAPPPPAPAAPNEPAEAPPPRKPVAIH
jgi:hypothetical protein